MGKYIVLVPVSRAELSFFVFVHSEIPFHFLRGFIPFADCHVAVFIHLVKCWQSICCELCEAFCLVSSCIAFIFS